MALVKRKVHKHFVLDGTKIKRAQKAFQAKTETEAIELALDFAVDEMRKNRVLAAANARFVRSGVEIRDVYGNLED
jgi:acetylornithine/succinyldiaminopimelate/putrescine aminotransferase